MHHHSHHRPPHVNGRGPDYTALDVDDQNIHQSPSRKNIKKGKTWCVKDVCGIFCAVLTWFLILYAEFVVLRVILVSCANYYLLGCFSIILLLSPKLYIYRYLFQSAIFWFLQLPYFGTIYSIVNTVLFQAISILAFSSHVRTMLTDPGAVSIS